MRVENTRLRSKKVIGDFLSKPEKTEVVARTTDAFIHQTPDTSGGLNAKLIKELVGSAVKVGSDIKKDVAEADSNQGRQDALTGKEFNKPSGLFSSPEEYSKAYHGVQDGARASKFKAEYLTALREQNYFMDTDNTKENKEQLYKGLYSKYFGDDYLKANGRDGMMTDRGLNVLEEANILGEQESAQAFQEKLSLGLAQDVYDNIEGDLGSMTSADELSVMIDAEYEEDKAQNGQRVDKAHYQNMMIDKLSVKALSLVRDGKIAEAEKLVGFLGKLRDEKGLLSERITGSKDGINTYGFKDRTDALRKQMVQEVSAFKTAQKEAEKKFKEKTFTNIHLNIAKLYDITDPIERHKFTMSLWETTKMAIANGSIEDEKVPKLIETVGKLSKMGGTSIESDQFALVEASKYVNKRGANSETLYNIFGSRLSADDLISLSNRLYTNSESDAKTIEGYSKEDAKDYDKTFRRIIGLGQDAVTGNSKLHGRTKLVNTGAMESDIDEQMNKWSSSFIKKNKRYPDDDELYTKMKEVTVRVREMYNPKMPLVWQNENNKGGAGGGKPKPSGDGTGSGKPKPEPSGKGSGNGTGEQFINPDGINFDTIVPD